MRQRHYATLEELRVFLAEVPDGTTCDILASDLEAGNFETANFVTPLGTPYDVIYTGPVAEGYVSPFEVGQVNE